MNSYYVHIVTSDGASHYGESSALQESEVQVFLDEIKSMVQSGGGRGGHISLLLEGEKFETVFNTKHIISVSIRMVNDNLRNL